MSISLINSFTLVTILTFATWSIEFWSGHLGPHHCIMYMVASATKRLDICITLSTHFYMYTGLQIAFARTFLGFRPSGVNLCSLIPHLVTILVATKLSTLVCPVRTATAERWNVKVLLLFANFEHTFWGTNSCLKTPRAKGHQVHNLAPIDIQFSCRVKTLRSCRVCIHGRASKSGLMNCCSYWNHQSTRNQLTCSQEHLPKWQQLPWECNKLTKEVFEYWSDNKSKAGYKLDLQHNPHLNNRSVFHSIMCLIWQIWV